MLRKKQNILLLTALCAGSIPSASVIAEEVPTIVISAVRANQSSLEIPINIKIISREEIDNSGAISVAEALTSVGGIYISDSFGDGNETKISMRGFGSTAVSNTLVIVDGRRLNNIDLSGPDLSAISVKDIEQIEIIQGSAGVLYGDQAVGGVINVITRKPDGLSVDAEVQVGSYDRTRFMTRIADKLSDGVSYSLSSEFLRSDNYRVNNSIDSMDVLGRIDYEIDSSNVFIEYQRATRFQELPGSLSASDVKTDRKQSNNIGDYLDNTTEVTRLGLRSSLAKELSLEAEVASRKANYTSQYSGFNYPIESEQFEFTPRIISSVPINGRDAVITAGIDYVKADYLSGFQDTERTSTALYSQLMLSLTDATSASVGVRKSEVEYESQDGEDSKTVMELGARHKLNETIVVFARYDESFRFGKIDEINFVIVGETLEIQTGTSKDVGVELNFDQSTIKAQLYRLDFENEISFDPNANGPYGSSFGANVNLDPTIHEGFIVEGDLTISRYLKFGAAFSYTNAEFKSGPLKGNEIAGVPDRQLTLSTHYRLSDNFKTYLEALYFDKHYAEGDYDNDNAKLDAYAVVNANLSYSWDELEVSMRVNNLMNEKYSSNATESGGSIYFFPSPERNFWIGASVKF